ncbi:MAG: hypothetical protein L0154_19950 [Chloroflexi bacterium]|nr:hypothetical protein [Chloroflexota bacterium]
MNLSDIVLNVATLIIGGIGGAYLHHQFTQHRERQDRKDKRRLEKKTTLVLLMEQLLDYDRRLSEVVENNTLLASMGDYPSKGITMKLELDALLNKVKDPTLNSLSKETSKSPALSDILVHLSAINLKAIEYLRDKIHEFEHDEI